MKNKSIISPSILNANFLNLEEDLKKLENLKIEWIHYDVMDYHFVSNLSFGPKILSDINSKFNFKIDGHLMVKISNISVKDYLNPFIKSGLNQITLHIEALEKSQIPEFKEVCIENNIKFSLAVNPDTKLSELDSYLSDLDNILVMSVQPGFGGQKFNEVAYEKIKYLKELRTEKKYKYTIQVDGGINNENFKKVSVAGADFVVIGSYLLEAKNIEERYKELFDE